MEHSDPNVVHFFTNEHILNVSPSLTIYCLQKTDLFFWWEIMNINCHCSIDRALSSAPMPSFTSHSIPVHVSRIFEEYALSFWGQWWLCSSNVYVNIFRAYPEDLTYITHNESRLVCHALASHVETAWKKHRKNATTKDQRRINVTYSSIGSHLSTKSPLHNVGMRQLHCDSKQYSAMYTDCTSTTSTLPNA